MMTQNDIRMCVADAMRDDVIENADSILRTLNSDAPSSWRAARGCPFTLDEVHAALNALMDLGLVAPAASQGADSGCSPIPREQAGTQHQWADLWFHLEPTGHEAVDRWWEAEGRVKYPLDQR